MLLAMPDANNKVLQSKHCGRWKLDKPMALKLNEALLSRLPHNVAGPTYDRSRLSPGIVHIGVGNFHRAHQAVYLDRLLSQGIDHDWAIIGAGIKHWDTAMRDRLEGQDWLTTIVELEPSGLNAWICGAMIDFLDVDASKLVDRLTQPDIRIVSLTVTEGGYFVDAVTGGFDVNHPEIRSDIAQPDSPKTVFGILIAALLKRKDAGIVPFTIMSCDNLPENGEVAQKAVLGLAAAQSSDTAAWIKANVCFPNGMVDCITPATSQSKIDMVADQFGIDDASPVVCEPFRQWVLEDKFSAGRPALENVGVEFVDDVAPYELMKLRILNGGHAIIAYPAGLMGIHGVHAAIANPLIRGFLEKLEYTEVIPTVPPIEGTDFHQYFDTVKERFSNEAVGDTIPRLCFDGSNRQPKFILPVIEDRISANLSIEGLALEVALWCRYCAGIDDNGNPIAVDDPSAERLVLTANQAKERPLAWLEMTDIFGNLGSNAVFANAFAEALGALWAHGTKDTLTKYIAEND